jgi:hypothetical protein
LAETTSSYGTVCTADRWSLGALIAASLYAQRKQKYQNGSIHRKLRIPTTPPVGLWTLDYEFLTPLDFGLQGFDPLGLWTSTRGIERRTSWLARWHVSHSYFYDDVYINLVCKLEY